MIGELKEAVLRRGRKEKIARVWVGEGDDRRRGGRRRTASRKREDRREAMEEARESVGVSG